MKADQKVQFENDDGKTEDETYTHFEKLVARVDVLQEQVEIMGRILKQAKLTSITEEYDMTPDLDDEAYKKLEEKE